MTAAEINIHGTCVVLGEAGILLRGPSGSGKSTLAREMIRRRRSAGGFAALVADDRVMLSRHHGRIVAAPHPAIAGLIEVRGIGLRPEPHVPEAVLRLVADLRENPAERMPEPHDCISDLLGVFLPRVAGSVADLAHLIEVTLSWQR